MNLTIGCAALLAGLAVLVSGAEPAARHRLRHVVRRMGGDRGRSDPRRGQVRRDGRGGLDAVWSRRLTALGCGVVAFLVVGGVAGLFVGPVAAVVADRLLARLEPRKVRIRRARMLADLPLAADLLVACLRAGRPVEAAVDAVAAAFDGPLGEELAGVAAALRMGADGSVAWARFVDDPGLAPFGRAMVRAWDSGAPLADTLDRLAEDARRTRRAAAEERARAVGVRAAAPLGLCFLPAFLLIGVVPVIIGTVRDVLIGAS